MFLLFVYAFGGSVFISLFVFSKRCSLLLLLDTTPLLLPRIRNVRLWLSFRICKGTSEPCEVSVRSLLELRV